MSISRNAPRLGALLIACSALVLAGCGSDDAAAPAPSTTTVSGIAATGACFQGSVVVVNAAGTRSDAVQTDCASTGGTGAFSVTIEDFPPFMVSASNGTDTLYSFAAAGGTPVNVTPLTSVALLHANDYAPLAQLFEAFADRQAGSGALTAEQVTEAAKKVVANLQAQFDAAGLTAADRNVFTGPLAAGSGTGMDGILDAVWPAISCSSTACSLEINTPQGVTLVSWNADIDTSGISFTVTTGGGSGGGAGGGGSYTVTQGACPAPAAGTTSLQVTTLGISTCVAGLPASAVPANQSEFCSDELVQGQIGAGGTLTINSCSFSGNQGTIDATVTTQGLSIPYTTNYLYISG
jgi:hypothetical protein